ncbi:hypothetical protein [Paraburkholderia tropica]|uniref:hypothetical protein n=1 Tax=Paraburkholderia tropica TaxID=92647 RepID=UPI003D29064C
MPVPTSFDDLSETASSNSPQGSEPVGTQANEYIQAAFAFIKQLHDGFTPLNTLTAPVGTRLVMQQAAAPTGWTIDTAPTFTDALMRFNQTVGSGGANAFSTTNAAYTVTSASTTLTSAQIPSHSHGITDSGHVHGITDNGHTHVDQGHSHGGAGGNPFFIGGLAGPLQGGSGVGYNLVSSTGVGNANLAPSTTGISINNGGTGITINATGGGGGHTHVVNQAWNIKYADCIVAVKS